MSETNLTNTFEYVHFLGVLLCYLSGFIYFVNVQSYCEDTYSDISTDMLFTCTGYDVWRCQDDDECGMNSSTFDSFDGWGSECKCYPSEQTYNATIAFGVLIGIFNLFYIVNLLTWWFKHESRFLEMKFGCLPCCTRYSLGPRFQSLIFLWDFILLVTLWLMGAFDYTEGRIGLACFWGGWILKVLYLTGAMECIYRTFTKCCTFSPRRYSMNDNLINEPVVGIHHDVSRQYPVIAPPYAQPGTNPGYHPSNQFSPGEPGPSAPPAYGEVTGSDISEQRLISNSVGKDLASQIQDLDRLRMQGIMTEDEFVMAKRKLIQGIA